VAPLPVISGLGVRLRPRRFHADDSFFGKGQRRFSLDETGIHRGGEIAGSGFNARSHARLRGVRMAASPVSTSPARIADAGASSDAAKLASISVGVPTGSSASRRCLMEVRSAPDRARAKDWTAAV